MTSLALRVAPGLALALLACASSRAALEPRYVAVHNTLAALGLVEVGPLHEGALAEGGEARLAVDLSAGCTLVVALGGPGVEDLDLALLDADGKVVQRDATRDAQPTLRVCIDRPQRRQVAVRASRGAGAFVAATWSGAAPAASTPPEPGKIAGEEGAGTCASPRTLVAGTSSGTTRHAASEHHGTCAASGSREVVHRLVLERRQRVVLDVDARFDTVLYVRRGDCEDEAGEVACNDDRPGATGAGSDRVHSSRIDTTLEPGTYFVFVDGYGDEAGPYRLSTTLADVPTLAEACRAATPLASHTTGSLAAAADHAKPSCGGGEGAGPDAVHVLDVPARERVRLTLATADAAPVLHLRRDCTDERSEVGCGSARAPGAGQKRARSQWTGVLDRGRHYVFADTAEGGAPGDYQVDVETAPEGGTGVPGDACSDAVPLSLPTPGRVRVEGDTFFAHDDVTTRRAATSGPDVVHRFDVRTRARIRGRVVAGSEPHVLALRSVCQDGATELATGESVDEIVAPGSYFLVVEGSSAQSFGRFEVELEARDESFADASCRSAPVLALGQTVKGTTSKAGDGFRASCAGPEERQASPDRVFRLVVPRRARVRVALETPTWDGVLALRKTCLDPVRTSVRANEVACNNDHHDTRHAQIETTLDAGTYWVLVDGHAANNEGTFTLAATQLPEPPSSR